MPEKMIIPMVYKNTGNQNEMLLNANIEMEIIPNDGIPSYFRRIGDENKNLGSAGIVPAPV